MAQVSQWISQKIYFSGEHADFSVELDSCDVSITVKSPGYDNSVFLRPRTRLEAMRLSIMLKQASKRMEAIGNDLSLFKPWNDPGRSQEDRDAWLNAEPASLERGE